MPVFFLSIPSRDDLTEAAPVGEQQGRKRYCAHPETRG